MRTWLLFAGALLLTALLYLPGLKGGYEFDDFPNVVDNTALHVTTLDASAWLEAMWASPSSDLQRPLASLSFALNHYFSGLAPAPMKATNLLIHLLNGLLLFVLLRRLARVDAMQTEASSASPGHGDWLALAVAGGWMLHPVNLTAVLYVVQRMESLAQVFVLTGLLLYFDARKRQNSGQSGAFWRLWIGIPICTLLGIAAKESAALLPLYALILEITVLRAWRRNVGELRAFYVTFLIIPGCVGLLWMLPRAFVPQAYSFRPFTLAQRLLTEPRVLLDYIAWILLPLPRFFSFYHDDYPISTDPWHPWSTLPALAVLVALAVAAAWLRRPRPLVALGLAWFLAAHALTATFIPLELVFEHRNYFASAGLLLAAFALLLPRQPGLATLALPRTALILAAICLCSITLVMRARAWGDPVMLAVTEATLHPDSPRATYNLGRTLVILSDYRPDSPNIPKAIFAFEGAARAPRAGILPEVALIMLASRTGRPIKDEWWDSMHSKLESRQPTIDDAEAIKTLTACQREGRCVLDDERMLGLYLAALQHGASSASVMYSYAIFAFNRLHDEALALQLARDAARSPDQQYRMNLVNFLIDLGREAEAAAELKIVEGKVRFGSMRSEIAKAQDRLNLRAAAPNRRLESANIPR
jgi:hypothetical protein